MKKKGGNRGNGGSSHPVAGTSKEKYGTNPGCDKYGSKAGKV